MLALTGPMPDEERDALRLRAITENNDTIFAQPDNLITDLEVVVPTWFQGNLEDSLAGIE